MATWINAPDQLDAYRALRPARIGLDTEFIRERTYWPQLALVQMAVGEHILLIDPLQPGMTAALRPWLEDTSITKIMHSASEDLVAFQHACGCLPRPLFDTQIAAALCGIGAGMGYQKLVAHVTGVELEKGEQRSDWMRRPLSQSQLHYAADDVRYLFAVHDALRAELSSSGRLAWLGAGALAVFTLLTIPVAHRFWELQGDIAFMEKMFVFEHISVVGGLILAGIAAELRRK